MSRRLIVRQKSKWSPTDILLVGYNVLVLLIALIFQSKIHSVGQLLMIHLAIIGFIILLQFLPDRYLSRLPHWLNIKIVYPFFLLGFLYNETDIFNNIFFENLDPYFSFIEYKLFGFQPAIEFSNYFSSEVFAELMYLGYFLYYPMVFILPIMLLREGNLKSAKKVVFTIISSFLIYYTIFLVIPVVGPQYYFIDSTLALPQGYIFGWLVRTIQFYGEAATAAFPSSHVGLCLVLIYLTNKYKKQLLLPMVIAGVLLLFSTVYIMAHYVVDVLAAFIFTPFVLYVSRLLYFKLNPKYPYEHRNN